MQQDNAERAREVPQAKCHYKELQNRHGILIQVMLLAQMHPFPLSQLRPVCLRHVEYLLELSICKVLFAFVSIYAKLCPLCNRLVSGEYLENARNPYPVSRRAVLISMDHLEAPDRGVLASSTICQKIPVACMGVLIHLSRAIERIIHRAMEHTGEPKAALHSVQAHIKGSKYGFRSTQEPKIS